MRDSARSVISYVVGAVARRRQRGGANMFKRISKVVLALSLTAGAVVACSAAPTDTESAEQGSDAISVGLGAGSGMSETAFCPVLDILAPICGIPPEWGYATIP